MAEKIICNTCGHVLEPGAQFCPICFSKVGGRDIDTNVRCSRCGNLYDAKKNSDCPFCSVGVPHKPASEGKGKLIAVIVAVAVEVLAIAALIVWVVLSASGKIGGGTVGKSGGGTPTPTSPTSPTPSQSATTEYQWTSDLEYYMNQVAPGIDVSQQYGIDQFCDALYENAIDVGSYEDYGNSAYDSNKNKFGGIYPTNFFCYAAENTTVEDLGYGKRNYQMTFVANDGSILRYEYIIGNGSADLADAIIAREGYQITAPSDGWQKVVDNDTQRVLMKGFDSNYPSLAVLELFAIDDQQILKMTFEYPATNDVSVSQQEQYVAECLVRRCYFSGETKGCRSFNDFRNGNDVQ